jgi:hypothetical protein
MDRTIAIMGNKKYKAYVSRIGKRITNIRLVSKKKDNGFVERESAYDGYKYEKEVSENDVIEFYREYFMAKYKNYDFFVIRDNKRSRKIQIVTADSNIGPECDFIQEDRDLFTKWLEEDEQYKLFHVREYYIKDKAISDEVTLNEYFNICNEEV